MLILAENEMEMLKCYYQKFSHLNYIALKNHQILVQKIVSVHFEVLEPQLVGLFFPSEYMEVFECHRLEKKYLHL